MKWVSVPPPPAARLSVWPPASMPNGGSLYPRFPPEAALPASPVNRSETCIASGFSFRLRERQYRPHLDASEPGARDFSRDGDRLLGVAGLHQVVTGELFLGLSERTIGCQSLAVTH